MRRCDPAGGVHTIPTFSYASSDSPPKFPNVLKPDGNDSPVPDGESVFFICPIPQLDFQPRQKLFYWASNRFHWLSEAAATRTANWEALTSPCLRGKIFLGLELRKKPSQSCCFNGRRGPLALPASSLVLTAAQR